MCGDDGKWGPATSCNKDGELRMQCAIKPNFDASALPVHICAEPVITNQNCLVGSIVPTTLVVTPRDRAHDN